MQKWNDWVHTGRDNKFPDGVRALDRVAVRYRDGDIETLQARCFLWIQFGEEDDVVAWRKAED